jgi:c-di-GMP-binding flagellar brake protein YcgR
VPALSSPATDVRKWKIARSFPRFAIDMDVSVSGLAPGEILPTRSLDIGLGGICVAIDEQKLRGGERLWIEFRLPSALNRLRVLAKLKYIAGERHGFQFLNLAPDQREQIRRACERLVIV